MDDKLGKIKEHINHENTSDPRARLEFDHLERQKAQDDYQERKLLKGHSRKIAIVFLYFVAIVVGFLLFVAAWHLIAPDCWTWLSNEQEQRIRDILLALSASGLVTAYSKKVA